MNILIYYPSNKRTVSIESVIEQFILQGHKVFLLTQSEENDLHYYLKSKGVNCYQILIKKHYSLIYYLRHLLKLISFIKKHNIGIIYSHLQQANIISVFAQFFTKAKFIICRHHSDAAFVDYNRNEQIFDKIINLLGKNFIVPSKKVYHQMVQIEKVNPNKKKIRLIPYGYHFNTYDKPNPEIVNKIKAANKCDLLILKVARFVKEKRHFLLINALDNLINKKKLNIKAILISGGPEQQSIENLIKEKQLENYILLEGFKPNVIDYISAADVIVHVSESEASNSLIKEAGILNKAVIVCNDVGDFDDYIQDGMNGYILNKENPQRGLENLLEKIYNKNLNITSLGQNLHESVISNFSIEKVISKYDDFNQVN